MAQETVYICDRCKKKGKEGFTAKVRIEVGCHWNGIENIADIKDADLCAECCRFYIQQMSDMLTETQRIDFCDKYKCFTK